MSNWDSMTPDEWRALQDKKLARYLRREVFPFHPYYGELARELGINVSDIRSVADLQRYSQFVTEKGDIVGRDKDFVLHPTPSSILRHNPLKLLGAALRGRGVPAGVKRILELDYVPVVATATTGRSGNPTAFVFSNHDINGFVATAARRSFEMLKFTLDPGDVGVSLFPVAIHLAHVFVSDGARAVPALILPLTGLPSERRILVLEAKQPKIIFGMSSYMVYLFTRAAQEGINLSSVERVVLGGEGVTEAQRMRIREALISMGSKDPVVLSSYGFTEGRLAFLECVEGAREGMNVGYHIPPDLGVMESVHIKERDGVITSVTSCEPGEVGELLYTPLQGHGTVALRWRTRDFACIEESPCPACGRSLQRVIPPIRRKSSDMIKKIKGTFVDLNDVEELFDGDPSVRTWQLVLDERDEGDHLTLYITFQDGLRDAAHVGDSLRTQFRAETEVSIDETIVEPFEEIIKRRGTDGELKDKKFIDNRPEQV